MTALDTDEGSSTPRGFLLVLSLGALLIIALVVAALAVPIQPSLHGGTVTVSGGTVVMPVGVGGNSKLNFDPPVVTVYLGFNATVTWDNQDTTKHTATANDNSFNSGDVLPGKTWSYTFSTPGNYSYYCLYHTTWMKATVVVKSGAPANSFTVNIPSGTGSNSALNYSPSNVTLVIGVNNTVIFLNQDSAKHTVTADDSSFNSGDILPGASWSHTFATPGTYSFHCVYHSYMKGTITVRS